MAIPQTNMYGTFGSNDNLLRSINVKSGDNLDRVKSIEEVKEANLASNSRAPFFDSEQDILYVKTTGASQFDYKIDIFELTHKGTITPGQQSVTDENYLTKDDFNKMKEEIVNDVKLLIQQSYADNRKSKESSPRNDRTNQPNG